jgi:DNA-directed RNA polymerase subunit beta'
MRTFHTGGVAGDDITQGLPRVEELFEARKPKRLAVMAESGGVVRWEEQKRAGQRVMSFTDPESGEFTTVIIPIGAIVKVREGDAVEEGTELTEGSRNPHDILRIKGREEVENYMVREVLRVYRQQGVDINDRHIEVIVRQMMRKVKIEEPGDTEFLMGTMVDQREFEAANEEVQKRIDAGEENLSYAVSTPVLKGITKASLATDSFLSAASFQETTRVLTEAAIKGKVDHLVGLKENVIIGKLVPAGSGMEMYRDFDIDKQPDPDDAIAPEAYEFDEDNDNDSLLA